MKKAFVLLALVMGLGAIWVQRARADEYCKAYEGTCGGEFYNDWFECGSEKDRCCHGLGCPSWVCIGAITKVDCENLLTTRDEERGCTIDAGDHWYSISGNICSANCIKSCPGTGAAADIEIVSTITKSVSFTPPNCCIDKPGGNDESSPSSFILHPSRFPVV